MKKVKQLLRSQRGDMYIEMFVSLMVLMMMLVLFINIATVFVRKQQLDMFAGSLCREAELYGCIGAETDSRASELMTQTGMSPTITWSKTGKLALGEDFTLTLGITQDIGFGDLGSYPITLTSRNSGQGEILWKD